MKKLSTGQVGKFLLFSSPCYWTCAVLFIVLVIWKVGLREPDLIPVVLVSLAIIVAGILLVKDYYWISFPMIGLGIYIALQDDQFVGHILHLFGAYIIVHYVICGVYVYMHKKRE